MFIHNFKYTFKILFRNRMLIFWTFAFPIILGTLFNLAFSNIEKSEKMDIIDIAIVDNEEFKKDEVLKETFKELGKENSDEQIFNIKYDSEENAKQLLENKKIKGYLIITEGKQKVVVKTNGIDETIFQYVLGEIAQTKEIVENLSSIQIKEEMMKGNVSVNYEKIYQDIIKMINNQTVKINDKSSKNLSYTMIEFYTLIAMTCLYGAILGISTINNTLANMSRKGMRIGVSPIKKWKLLLSSVCASYVAQLIGLALLFAYTILVLHVDYGNQILLIILLALTGSLAGLTLGIFVGSVFKTNENTKTGIVIATTMLGCFLSGMMGITMKYIVDKNVPIVNKLNPASMITDGFYSLYYYDTTERFWFNMGSLLIFSFIMIAISFVALRRQKYDSI